MHQISNPSSSRPGRVYLEPVRKIGRQKNCGSIAWVRGHMTVCIGYSEDGYTAVYATVDQIAQINRGVHREHKKLVHRLLQWLIRHYEAQHA